MPSERLGVLIHGAGWVSTQHIAAFQRHPRTEVVAVSSRSMESARRRVLEAGLSRVEVYDDLRRGLDHPGVDIVAVCTPQHVHAENVVAAAEAGKHVVIEKPAGNSLDELRRMQKAVQDSGVKTVVSFVLRWNPLFEMLKSLLADGAFGRPYYIEADYLSHNGSWWTGWSDARTKEQGVSAMLVGGCHAADALRWFASEGRDEAGTPVEVFAMAGGYRKGSRREYRPPTNTWVDTDQPMEYDGLEVALVRFENGALGKVSVNADCIMPYRLPIRIFGDRGTVMDNNVWSHKFPGQRDWLELRTVSPDSSDVSHHPFQGEIDHFVGCVERGTESHANLEDALKTHEIVFGALESYKTGRPVRLPLPE